MRTDELFQFARHEWENLQSHSREDAYSLLKRIEQLCDTSTNIYMVDMRTDDPNSFAMHRVLENVNLRGGGLLLGEYPDQTYMRADVMPFYQDCKQSGEISVMRMKSRIQDQIAVYDRIIMPATTGGDLPWAFSITRTRLLLPAKPVVLTGREQDVLDLLAQGFSSKEIATKLSLSPRTVEHRVEALKIKLGARNVAHAVAIGVAGQLTSP